MIECAKKAAQWVGLSLLTALLFISPAAANDDGLPVLFSNQNIVEAWKTRSKLDIEDHLAVFRFVFGALPDKVTVYPTENYYYFYFYLNGVKYAGNIRLDVDEVAEGKIIFAYFRDSTLWANDDRDYGSLLGKADGVTITKTGKLSYSIGFEGKTVQFALNDLSNVKPPEGTMKEGEKYLGPVFDESGIRFFLIFDETRKLFHYVLDETVPVSDELKAIQPLKHTLVGWRTGFAFFNDKALNRKVLIGVHNANTQVNNYLDGPFDQLPDNFIKGDELRQAFLAVNPSLKGKIDRFGNSLDRKNRELIAPYFQYEALEELELAEACFLEEPAKAVDKCMEVKLPPE